MKAILLAAGVGSRIVKDIGQMPKSLVEVNGKPLLLHTLDLLKKNGMEIVIITGFQHKRIEEAIKDYSVTLAVSGMRTANSIHKSSLSQMRMSITRRKCWISRLLLHMIIFSFPIIPELMKGITSFTVKIMSFKNMEKNCFARNGTANTLELLY